MEKAKAQRKRAVLVRTMAVAGRRALLPALAVLMLLPWGATSLLAEDDHDPEQWARHFMELFEAQDLDTIATLFAPGALVQRARLGGEAPEFAHFAAAAWVADTREGIAAVEDFKMEVLEVTSLGFGEGTTVCVRFRATGRVGENRFFINNGVDSFSFSQMGGEWKIVLYNSMEKLELGVARRSTHGAGSAQGDEVEKEGARPRLSGRGPESEAWGSPSAVVEAPR